VGQDVRRNGNKRQDEDTVLGVIFLRKRLDQYLRESLIIIKEFEHGKEHRYCLDRSARVTSVGGSITTSLLTV
jgi:hypothetical protein